MVLSRRGLLSWWFFSLVGACGGGAGGATSEGTGSAAATGPCSAGEPTTSTTGAATGGESTTSTSGAPTSSSGGDTAAEADTGPDAPPILPECHGPPVVPPDPKPAALELRYVDDFALLWNDAGSGGWFDGAYYRPVVPDGFFALTHYGQSDHGVTRGYTFAARALDPTALAAPTGYTLLYTDAGSGADMDGSFWRPSPPPGYVCLGDLAQQGYAEPSPDAIRCVREDLVAPGLVGNGVWNDRGTGADATFGSWQVVPADDSGLFVAGFVGSNSHSEPPPGPVHVLARGAFAAEPATPDQLAALIDQRGPVLRLHPEEKYLPDDAEATLDESASLAWGLIQNEGDYDTFMQMPLGAHKTSAASVVADVEDFAKPADPGSPDFRYWLDLDLGQVSPGLPPVTGDVKRAVVLVRARAWDAIFTDLQFWVFYPFNGPGKFRVTCGAIDDHVVMDGPGRHYGDWEHVSVRVVHATGELVGVYLSRHSGGEWIAGAQLDGLGYAGTRPIVYAARDSHAHYPSAGTHYYLRPWSLDAGICTAAVDLEDWTAEGGHALLLHDPAHHQVVCSDLPGHTPEIPGWLLYDSRWGQYERLTYTYEFPIVELGVYDYQEVGSGPSGPAQKDAWARGDSSRRWWWLPNLEGEELCVGGVDDDGDQKTDCADEDCAADPTCNL